MTLNWQRPKSHRPKLPQSLKLTPPRSGPKPNAGQDTYAFQCKAFGLPTCIAQFPFALSLGRKFTADFCFQYNALLVDFRQLEVRYTEVAAERYKLRAIILGNHDAGCICWVCKP